MNRNNRIKDLPAWDKAGLLRRDNQGENSEESRSENLGNDLIERIAEANGPEFIQRVSSRDFWDEDQEGSIKFFK